MSQPNRSDSHDRSPQIEVAEDTDDDGSGYLFFAGGFLFCIGAAIFLLIGDNWESQVSQGGRRGRWLADVLNDIGKIPTVSALGVLALLFAFLAVRSWRKESEGAA